MDLNVLKQYMDFYKQQGLGSADYSAHNGFNPTPFNPNADAERWAMGAMGGGGGTSDRMPNYFGGAQGSQGGFAPMPAYVQPKPFMEQMPQSSFQPHPLTGQINNYLASIIGKR